MARTFLRQLTQIAESDTYDDTIAPSEANYETNPAEIEADLNSLRSRSNDFLNRDNASFTGDWFGSITAPSTFENGIARGINKMNQELHDLERKRVLDRVAILGNDIVIGSAGDQFVIIGTGELPGNTTMAVGAVTTLGTLAAFEASFGTATLTEIVGANALRPKNLAVLWQSTGANIGDPVEDGSGLQIFGLLQSETSTDGHTATDTTPFRLQLSFVKTNPGGTDLVLVTAGEMDSVTFDYAPVERFALEDIPEESFLGTNFIDSGVANATRQTSYDNQGTTVVELTTNATLDLNSAGIAWALRDLTDSQLLTISEGSTGGTTTMAIGAAVDTFDNDAVVNDFANSVLIDSGGASPIDIGGTSGRISATSGNLTIQSITDELFFGDINRTGSTWSTNIKFSETTAEWDLAEVNFGEASLLSMLNQAVSTSTRTRVQTTVTSNTSADVDVNGPIGANNLDTNLPPYNLVTFVTDADYFLNGNLLRNNASSGAEDIYPGTTPSNGDVRLTFALKGTGSKPDQITAIVNGQ